VPDCIDIIQKINETQYRTESPDTFEWALAEALACLGLSAKRIGGPNEPDVLVECNHRVVTIDAKTLRRGSAATEQTIAFSAQKRYRRKYNAVAAAVIAAAFRRGNVLKTAEDESVILIKTEAISQLMHNHNIRPYSPDIIFDLLFKEGKVMISREDIETSLNEAQQSIIEIVRDLLKIFEKHKERVKTFGLERLQDIFLGKDKWYEDKNVKLSLELLQRLNILRAHDQGYELTRNIGDILEDVNVVSLARGIAGGTSVSEEDIITQSRVGKTLDHILAIIRYMKKGDTRRKACLKVARQYNVTVETISDKCTRGLALETVEEFDHLYAEGKIEQLLKRRFPDGVAAIVEAFSSH
jgi:hypothetical protein